MKLRKLIFLISLSLMFALNVAGQTQHVTVSPPLQQLSNDPVNLNRITAQLTNGADSARAVLLKLLQDKAADDIDKKGFYCIIHLVRWSDPSAANAAQTVQAQNWYLYNNKKLIAGSPDNIPRLYGAKSITLLTIQFNYQFSTINDLPTYQIEITKKTPAYLSHLIGLFGLYNASTSSGLAAIFPDFYGAASFDVDYRVSDITITPKLARNQTGAVQDMGVVQKFDNEGKYYFDFSVGVPVRKISQLSFDSTANTVTAKEVDKTDILALVNLYPKPVDIRSNSPNLLPHFVGGVAIAKQPLHKIFVGTGFGPLVANFYIGALFAKEEQLSTLKPGDPATPGQLNNDLRHRYKTHIAFGLNLPVGAIVEKLKGK